jgi:hypothetical protein
MIALQKESQFCEQDNIASGQEDQFAGVGRLLSAVNTVLHETLDRFEQASGKVTQTVLTRGSPGDHELIEALQNFDRLHQEFSAIKHMITHCATATAPGSVPGEMPSDTDAVSAITLTDIKQRLLTCLGETLPRPAEEVVDEAVF